MSEWAFAQSNEPMVKIRIALKNTWRVPSLSASHPENGMTVAMVNEYAITTPCMRSGASPRLFAMAGSAVLTMVESRVCMKNPVATSHNMMVSDWGEGVGATVERIVSGMKGAGGGSAVILRGCTHGLRTDVRHNRRSDLTGRETA